MSSRSSDYKYLCYDLRHDLKRAKRDLEDADDRARKYELESKKARIESDEILKLYRGLQSELQLAYERNAKLQVDKASFEGLLDSERREFENYKRQQVASVEESKKLKDALCAMKMEKLELETKFNAIVMENKDLRDRARQYEPRLREIDEIKRKLTDIQHMVKELQPEVRSQNELADRAQIRQEQIDRYAKWNDLLKRECEQKTQQLGRFNELVDLCRCLEEEKSQLKLEMEEMKSRFSERELSSSDRIVDRGGEFLRQIRQLRELLFTVRDEFQRETTVCNKDVETALNYAKLLMAALQNNDKGENSCIEIGTSIASHDDC